MAFHDVWMLIIAGDILVTDCSYIYMILAIFMLSSLLSSASVMTLSDE